MRMPRLSRSRPSEPVVADILVVCTGNICRSPYVALTLAARHPSLVVTSAGTGAMVGSGLSEPLRPMLLARGLDPADHAATQVSAARVAGAALIIAATRAHRAALVRLSPGAETRCYTLLELARLLSAPSVGEPRGGIPGLLAVASAGLSFDDLDHDDDLIDPWQQGQLAYDQMVATADAALAVIDPWLDSRPLSCES